MDSATILVLVLCAGVAALLVWFEVNSRRNDANKQQKSDVVQSWFQALPKESQNKVESSGSEKKR